MVIRGQPPKTAPGRNLSVKYPGWQGLPALARLLSRLPLACSHGETCDRVYQKWNALGLPQQVVSQERPAVQFPGGSPSGHKASSTHVVVSALKSMNSPASPKKCRNGHSPGQVRPGAGAGGERSEGRAHSPAPRGHLCTGGPSFSVSVSVCPSLTPHLSICLSLSLTHWRACAMKMVSETVSQGENVA